RDGSALRLQRAVSGVAYSAGMRFGEEKGTNPEELLGAAHAGCFNMALAFALSGSGKQPEELRTTAVVSIEQQDGGFTITSVALSLTGRVPGMSEDEFRKAAEGAKAGCPVSKLFKGAEITVDAKLAQ
ncbi:MAG TPA: OsmC family peroxiredoxin, partial [Candidatus Synoicihabitans sp.]|nr:OsmC family peroxiredoxin [Candidatus Synoicihabitans sp.]